MSTELHNPSPYRIAVLAGLHPSPAQSAVLKATYGEPLTREELKAWRRMTGTIIAKPNAIGYGEVFAEVGRRGGKDTHLAAPIGVAESLRDVSGMNLAPGEIAKVIICAPTLAHCETCLSAHAGLYERLGVPHTRTQLRIELPGRRTEVVAQVADLLLRGSTALAIIVTETAFLPLDEDADGWDVETFAALRPMLLTTRGKLISISTPLLRRGVHFDTVRASLGKTSGRVLAVHGSSWEFNTTITEAQTREIEKDHRRWRREYLAEAPTTDHQSAFDSRDIGRAITGGVTEREPSPALACCAAGDLAFRGDGCVVGIAHVELKKAPNAPPKTRLVLDLLRIRRARPGQPLDPEMVIDEWSGALRRYGVKTLWLDSHGYDLAKSRFSARGIRCELLSMGLPQQAIRFDSLGGRLRAGTIDLLDDDTLRRELGDLRFELRPGGTVRYEAPRRKGASDDTCDVLAALCGEASRELPASGGNIRCETRAWHNEEGVFIETTYREEKIGPGGVVTWLPALPPRNSVAWMLAREERRREGIAIPEDEADALAEMQLNAKIQDNG